MQIWTTEGCVEGIQEDGYTIYKGIPYALPPVGPLRWKEPQPPKRREGVLKADHFSPICYQTLPSPDMPITGRFFKEFYSDPAWVPEMSEDCLYLNIWVPEGADGSNPVAFWIHGGGFGGGFGSEVEFDGAGLAKRGVVLVTINYRLGIFGFLAHEQLSAESRSGSSGNYGILDQIAALRWVYANIRNFGGDPNRITVFGQSAGSMSTQVLVSSPMTQELIAGAILMSGLACEENIVSTPALSEGLQYGEMFLQRSGKKTVEELRQLSPEELMQIKSDMEGELWRTRGNGMVFVPYADGYVLPDSVQACYKRGGMKQIPYLLGTVIDDLGSTADEIAADQPGALQKECERWARKVEEACHKNSYLYFFRHKLPGDDWGAFHTGEIWYSMGTLGRSWRPFTEEDYELSHNMLDAWASFIKTGSPAVAGQEAWRPYSEKDPYIRVFK